MKKILVLACLMLSSVAFIPSNVCASNTGDITGPTEAVFTYEHLRDVMDLGKLKTSNHVYEVKRAITRSGKIITYAVDESGNVFYDLNKLP
ncbi:hypothetical protein [Alloprevotella tannerae]|uniref:hypothetical protein n=1 Tax=Alloprevotella tannerae TaxID=76122 RepID=UPI00260110F3|nr:hypothetical protein [Alloprevotella tannerae]